MSKVKARTPEEADPRLKKILWKSRAPRLQRAWEQGLWRIDREQNMNEFPPAMPKRRWPRVHQRTE